MANLTANVANRPGGDPISPALGDAQRFKMGANQATQGGLDVYLYGHVDSSFYDFWSGELVESKTSADYFKQVLFEENPGAKEINLYINSEGGDVFEGTAIANMLRRHSAKINVTVDGFACSVASVIAMAGDTISMPRNAVMMIHNMWTWTAGNANELREVADTLDKLMASNRTIYLDKAGEKLTEDKLIEMLDAETYLSAEECLEYGLCDQILDHAQSKPPAVKDNDMEGYVAYKKNLLRQLKELNITADEGGFSMPKEEKRTYFQTLLKG